MFRFLSIVHNKIFKTHSYFYHSINIWYHKATRLDLKWCSSPPHRCSPSGGELASPMRGLYGRRYVEPFSNPCSLWDLPRFFLLPGVVVLFGFLFKPFFVSHSSFLPGSRYPSLFGRWSLDMEFLWSKLDFEIGMHFEKNLQRSTRRCIHDLVGNDSGFHLLATFRRYLF
jgi:hypothetical protein